MNLDNKVTRRVVATRTNSDKDATICETERTTNGRLKNPRYRNLADTNHKLLGEERVPKHKRIRQIHNYRFRDQERVLFLVLALLGALLIIIACSTFTFTIVHEGENRFTAMCSRIINRPMSLRNQKNNNTEREVQSVVTPAMNEKGPLDIDFLETTQTYFVASFIDAHQVREKLDEGIIQEQMSPDFGGLNLTFSKNGSMTATRPIRHDPMQLFLDYRDYRSVARDDDQDNYYAHDDDYTRNPFIEDYDQDEASEVEGFHCRRISEHRLYFPNCNSFHETPLLDSQATVIGAGSYRQAMMLNNSFGREREAIVVKDIHFRLDFLYDVYEYTRMDAIVAERLTSSRRIYNIYGTCGIGIMSEFFPHGQIEAFSITDDVIERTDETKGPLICYNNLTGLMKLELSLHMAEALVDLHGYAGGVIVHQDVKLDQFFLNSDMTEVILNDFNRAEFMLWDEEEEEYCSYREGFGAGNWRSPEEYHDEYLTEQVDVFSLGNNMYGLLTGLMVFYEIESYGEIQDLVGDGEKAYIDPRYKERSLAEAKLVEIINQCHEYYPEDRPSIFEVVDMLWQALEEVNEAMDKDKNNEI